MLSVERVAIFWVVNASSGEKSCSQFSIPTGSGAGEEGGVLNSLKRCKQKHEADFPRGWQIVEKIFPTPQYHRNEFLRMNEILNVQF